MIKLKKLLSMLFVGLTLLTAVAPSSLALAADVETQYAFDYTDIETDLKQVDLLPYEKAGKTELIMLVEKDVAKDMTAIYVYVYNASKISLSENSASNVINMADVYDTTSFEPNSYRNFKLKYCDKTDDKSVYKFRVLDVDNVILNNAIMFNKLKGERRYDVAGIQLIFEASQLAVDYPVSKTYFYEGTFEDRTLNVNELETVQLEVHPAWYRSDSSAAGKNYRHQLNSVYFAVDYKILAKRGALQKVKAEWYEYKTEPIVVLGSKENYDKLLPYKGVDISQNFLTNVPTLSYGKDIVYTGTSNGMGLSCYTYDWAWNLPQSTYVGEYSADTKCNRLSFLFYSKGRDYMEYSIPADELKQYIYSYSASANKGYLPIKNGNISADLFLDTVDSGRTRGYNVTEISVEDKYDLLSYKDTHDWWSTVCDYGFLETLLGWTPSDSSIKNVVPIYQVTPEDMKKDEYYMSNDLLIDAELISDFTDYVNENESKNKATFLFRFANTEYFSSKLDDDLGYVAQETVFLDFDILELTFKNDVGETVLPVVASPIDHVASIVPPVQISAWWIYLAIIGIVSIVGLCLSVNYRSKL